MKLSDRSVEVGLAYVDSAAGQFPPAAEVRVIGVVGVKEQHLVLGVQYNEPDCAAIEDG